MCNKYLFFNFNVYAYNIPKHVKTKCVYFVLYFSTQVINFNDSFSLTVTSNLQTVNCNDGLSYQKYQQKPTIRFIYLSSINK